MSTVVRRHTSSAGLPGGGLAEGMPGQSGIRHAGRPGAEIFFGINESRTAPGTEAAVCVTAWEDAAEK